MAGKIDRSDPAMPTVEMTEQQADGTYYQHLGLTKREWFAGHIMAGMNASLSSTTDWPVSGGAQKMASVAVMQADALVAALAEGN